MSRRKLTQEQQAAVKLFRGFRERAPSKIKNIDFEVPSAVAVMGTVEFIGYRTTHGKKGVLYTHDFAAGSRPLMCAGAEEGQLYLIGGRFHVTERGIVDLDASGDEIEDDSERYE